ncbi:hypothetical protein Hdeb2414_s0028g00704261 [Helianthus debilis subsp. tardiflorus]
MIPLSPVVRANTFCCYILSLSPPLISRSFSSSSKKTVLIVHLSNPPDLQKTVISGDG